MTGSTSLLPGGLTPAAAWQAALRGEHSQSPMPSSKIASSASTPVSDGLTTWQERERDFLYAAQCALKAGARDAWGEMVRDLMPWGLIVNAATFDEGELGYSMSRASAVRRFARFFRVGREKLGRPLEGFMACEVGPSGMLEHGHGLLALGAGLWQGDITALSRVWREVPGNGFIKLEEPRSAEWFARYVSKHTVKQLGDVVFSVGCGRRWYGDWA